MTVKKIALGWFVIGLIVVVVCILADKMVKKVADNPKMVLWQSSPQDLSCDEIKDMYDKCSTLNAYNHIKICQERFRPYLENCLDQEN